MYTHSPISLGGANNTDKKELSFECSNIQPFCLAHTQIVMQYDEWSDYRHPDPKVDRCLFVENLYLYMEKLYYMVPFCWSNAYAGNWMLSKLSFIHRLFLFSLSVSAPFNTINKRESDGTKEVIICVQNYVTFIQCLIHSMK